MAILARDPAPESTLAFLRDGYRFISNRCERYGTDLFETRVLLRRTICMRGEDAARLFYDTSRFRRRGAAPTRVQRTLLGVGGVQSLDARDHRHRKRMLMTLTTAPVNDALVERFADDLDAAIGRWEQQDEVVLHDEVARALCTSVCAWAGVPLPAGEVDRRTRDFLAMIGSGASVGPQHWRGRGARRRAEAWITDLIAGVRRGTTRAQPGSALEVVATHRDLEDRPLPAKTAAVELLNLLRPTVAVTYFVVFAALALHEQPECYERLRGATGDERGCFVQEVRRHSPFFPAAAARVRRTFAWRGIGFPRGRLVLLDLYGTNHHPQGWSQPDRFLPERFAERGIGAFDLVPQGGGDHHEGHRCAGEWMTIRLLHVAVAALTDWMTYEVPPQDLHVDLRHMPARPRSHFVIRDVRRRGR